MKLTVKGVAKLLAAEELGRHGENNLFLQIQRQSRSKKETITASWLFRYQRAGRDYQMGLGAYDPERNTLDDAKARARAAHQLILDGKDPLAAKNAAKAARAKALTFEECARQFFDAQQERWSNPRHRAQFLSSMEAYAIPKIGTFPIAEIDTGLVMRVLEQEHEGKKLWAAVPETANRVRVRMEQVLDWAKARKLRTGENPAAWKGNLKHLLTPRKKQRKHHAALSYDDIPAFMTALRDRKGVDARALEFAVLTLGRTTEVLEACWSEIDEVKKVWTVPAERMKARREHRVPLSNRALEILKGLPTEEGNPFIFIGERKPRLNSMAMLLVLKKMGHDQTVHGFRSTFRDWAAEQTNYPREVAEMALAHAVGDATERAYMRTDLFDRRRRLMTDWARYCYAPVKKTATVTPIRRMTAS